MKPSHNVTMRLIVISLVIWVFGIKLCFMCTVSVFIFVERWVLVC